VICYDLVDKRISLFDNNRNKDKIDVRGFYKAFFLAYYHLVYYKRILPNYEEMLERERLLSNYYMNSNNEQIKWFIERQIDKDMRYVLEFLTVYKRLKHREDIQSFQDKFTLGVRKSDYRRLSEHNY
jgi:hypothetical protein